MAPNTDRNLLFGILALQMDFINRDQLIAAMQAWVLDKSRSLGEIVREQGVLAADAHGLLEALVDKHMQMHGGAARQSLAAVSSIESSLRNELASLGDAEIEASLPLVASRRQDEPQATTVTWSAGQATSLGRFQILRPHARGGLGEVFVANDRELHREVALKQIQPRKADDPASRARFLMEAEITGGLEHPGIVPVYGLGHYDDGRPYYAMRFIRGESLDRAIENFHSQQDSRLGAPRRMLELRKLLGRFIDVCNAIEYAHSRGVLHRDLKPGNVMVGKYGETLVVDWGIAKPLGETQSDVLDTEPALVPSSGSGMVQTLAGSAIGTPRFMSPEQAAGRLDELGPASDIYSLGATLYAVLTGRPPIEGGDAGEVLRAVQRGDITPPRKVQPRVPAALQAICLKAMALRPEDRYASCAELADDVEAWLADAPVRAYRNMLYRMRLGLKHHRTAAVAATLLLLGLAGVFGYFRVRADRTARAIEQHLGTARIATQSGNTSLGIAELSVAEALGANETGHAARTVQSRRWLEQLRAYEKFSQLYESARLGVFLPDSESKGDGYAQAFTRALDVVGALDNPDWDALFEDGLLSAEQVDSVEAQVGELLAHLALRRARDFEDDEDGRRRTSEALALLDRAARHLPPGPGALTIEALWRRRLGEDDQADAAFERAEAVAKENAGAAGLFDRYILAQISAIKLVNASEKAKSIYEEILREDPSFFRAHFGLFNIYHDADDLNGQLRHLKACLALSPNDAMLFYIRGMTYFVAGPENFEHYRRAFDDFDASVKRDPDYAVGYFYRGRMQVVFGKWSEAVDDFTLAISKHPALDSAYHWRAIGNAKIDRHAEAAEDAEHALTNDPDDRLTHYYAARAFAQAVRAVRAVEQDPERREELISKYAKRCREVLERGLTLGFDDLSRLGPGSDFDPVYDQPGFRDLVESSFRKAIAEQEKLLQEKPDEPEPSLELADLYLGLADLVRDGEQPAEALDWYAKSIEILRAAMKEHPSVPALLSLRRAYETRAKLLDQLKRFDEAEADWRLLITRFSSSAKSAQINWAHSLATAKEHVRAAPLADEQAGAEGLEGVELYNLACVYSLCFAAAAQDENLPQSQRRELGERHARRALELLHKAREAGFFDTAANVEHLGVDADFEALRGRPDFQQLSAELSKEVAPSGGPGS